MKKISTMDLILVIIGVTAFIFTIKMTMLYEETGGIPDTLVTCVFGALFGECGAMAWIKTTKEKRRDRDWAQEDKKNGGIEVNHDEPPVG